jgi:hypothetical protein
MLKEGSVGAPLIAATAARQAMLCDTFLVGPGLSCCLACAGVSGCALELCWLVSEPVKVPQGA